jgi:hypothetical protein
MKVSLQRQARTFLAEFELGFCGMGLCLLAVAEVAYEQPVDTEYRMINK